MRRCSRAGRGTGHSPTQRSACDARGGLSWKPGGQRAGEMLNGQELVNNSIKTSFLRSNYIIGD